MSEHKLLTSHRNLATSPARSSEGVAHNSSSTAHRASVMASESSPPFAAWEQASENSRYRASTSGGISEGYRYGVPSPKRKSSGTPRISALYRIEDAVS